jgi:hypothetical protein
MANNKLIPFPTEKYEPCRKYTIPRPLISIYPHNIQPAPLWIQDIGKRLFKNITVEINDKPFQYLCWCKKCNEECFLELDGTIKTSELKDWICDKCISIEHPIVERRSRKPYEYMIGQPVKISQVDF